MGVIAHPGIIKDMKPANNANYIFTTGGDDYTINIFILLIFGDIISIL